MHGNPDQEVELEYWSFAAYSVTEDNEYEQDRIAQVVNGEIISELHSDDLEAYVGISEPLSKAGKVLVAKQWRAIHRRSKRKQEKAIAERHFLPHIQLC